MSADFQNASNAMLLLPQSRIETGMSKAMPLPYLVIIVADSSVGKTIYEITAESCTRGEHGRSKENTHHECCVIHSTGPVNVVYKVQQPICVQNDVLNIILRKMWEFQLSDGVASDS